MDDKNHKIKQILSIAFENHKKNNLKLAEKHYKKILTQTIRAFNERCNISYRPGNNFN